MFVRTTPASFFVARTGEQSRNGWWQHARHLPRLYQAMRANRVEHAVFMQQLSEDLK